MTITFNNDQFKSGDDYYLVTGEFVVLYYERIEDFFIYWVECKLFKQIFDHPETGIFVDPALFESRIEELAIEKYKKLSK